MTLDSEKTEEEIVDNYRTDTLYAHKFKSDVEYSEEVLKKYLQD